MVEANASLPADPPNEPAVSRPASTQIIRSRSSSCRYTVLIARPVRDVASQLIWRTSSSVRYSRTASNSVPKPSGPRLRPSACSRPRRTIIANRWAVGRSGCTVTEPAGPTSWTTVAKPSGPSNRTATFGRAWIPRRRAEMVPSNVIPSACDGATLISGGCGWRMVMRRDRRVCADGITSIENGDVTLRARGRRTRATAGG